MVSAALGPARFATGLVVALLLGTTTQPLLLIKDSSSCMMIIRTGVDRDGPIKLFTEKHAGDFMGESEW